MTLSSSQGPGGVRLVTATGDLDVVTAPQAEQALDGAGPLVLDLSAVAFFDSAGVRLVHRTARACRSRGDGFRVVAPPGSRARRVLDVVGMGEGLVADDLPAAVAQVQA